MTTKKKVVGYYPGWKEYQEEKLQYETLTHIIYAFAIPLADGTVKELDHPDGARRLIEEAHKNQVQVLLAVGGWDYKDVLLEGAFAAATEGTVKQEKLAASILKMCERYGFDGIDIDWEYPRLENGSGKQYEALLSLLAERLHANGKLLTTAVISGIKGTGGICPEGAGYSDMALSTVDWLNVMAYDGGDGELHSSYEFAVECAEYWRDTRNVPAEQVVLGVPFYGRPGWAAYEEILKEVPDAGEKDYCGYQGMEVYYNGIQTIKAKAQYAKEKLGGIMIWELCQDAAGADSLLKAIGEVMDQ